MINKLNPLPKIPYVDGVPMDSLQSPILWIINGETLDGAPTKTTGNGGALNNEGSLNRTGVLVQRNAVQLEANTATQTGKINEVIDQVNLISENLAAISDDSVIDKLDQVVQDVAVLKVEMDAVETTSASHTLKLHDLDKEIGQWDATTDPKHRTIRKDIIFLKGEIGKYVGFDENGDVDPSSTGSGMKYKIMTNAQAISIHEGRITKLEDDWANSDVGHLTDEVTDLRNEMGPKHLATFESVYVRLNKNDTNISGINTELSDINQYIGRTGSGGGTGSISARMTTAESNILSLNNQINAPVTGVLPRVILLENSIGNSQTPGSIRYDIADTKREVSDIWMVVGEDSDEGLLGEMVQVMSDIGTDSQPTSIKGRLLNVENIQRDDHQRLADVEAIVGNTSSGLVATNIMMGKAIYGDATNADPFLKDGIQKTARDNKADIGVNTVGFETGIYKLIADLTARVAAVESVHATLTVTPVVQTLAFTTDLPASKTYAPGANLDLAVVATGGVTPYSYKWFKDNGEISGEVSASLSIAAVAGVYKVEVTDTATTKITSVDCTVTIAAPLVFVEDLPAVKNATVGENFNIDVEVGGGVAPYTYFWTKDGVHHLGSNTTGVVFSQVDVDDSATWQIKVTDTLGTEITSTACVVTVTAP